MIEWKSLSRFAGWHHHWRFGPIQKWIKIIGALTSLTLLHHYSSYTMSDGTTTRRCCCFLKEQIYSAVYLRLSSMVRRTKVSLSQQARSGNRSFVFWHSLGSCTRRVHPRSIGLVCDLTSGLPTRIWSSTPWCLWVMNIREFAVFLSFCLSSKNSLCHA